MTRTELLFFQLARLRREYVRGRMWRRAVEGFAGLFGLFVAGAALDAVLRLRPAWCWGVWLGLLAALGWGLWAVVRTARRPVSDEALAVLVERVSAGLGNHLINAVQFAHAENVSPGFVEAVLAEADPDLGRLRAQQLYSQAGYRRACVAIAAAVAVAAAAVALAPRRMACAALRVLAPMAGIPPYTDTRIRAVHPGETVLPRGQDLAVAAELAGDLPREAVILWERVPGKPEPVPLRPAERGRFEGELKGVFHDCRYRVLAGDAASDWFRVRVTSPPGLVRWEARIVPPEYLGRGPYTLSSSSTDAGVPAGSAVALDGWASAPLAAVTAFQDDVELAAGEPAAKARFGLRFAMREGGPVRLRLRGEDGLEAAAVLPFVAVPDQKPSVALVEGKQRVVAAADAQVPVVFRAEDDNAVTRVGLERLLGEDHREPVAEAVPAAPGRVFAGRFLLDVASFDARPGDTLRFRLWAEDNGEDRDRRRGYSAVLQVTIPASEDQRAARRQLATQAEDGLRALAKLQRENLRNTRSLSDLATLGRPVASPQIQPLHLAQQNIRVMAADLLRNPAPLGDLATVLAGLVNHEMTEVLERFEEAHRAQPAALPGLLQTCVRLETAILAALTGIPSGLASEQGYQDKADLFGLLQRIVAAQRQNLQDTRAAQGPGADAAVTAPLAAAEDRIAQDLVRFGDLCLVLLGERLDDDFARQLRAAYDTLDQGKTYEKMIAAAESLETGAMAAALQSQEEALRDLMQALNILNQWRARNARRLLAEAAGVLRKTREELTALEARQSHIAEVTRDLARRGAIDDEVRAALREMDEQQKDMARLVEELANDLYQFPELPVCNELNSRMREILEDVEQAQGSENAPAMEIAVQKEDSLLDAIRNTKERVEDVEMWLMDIPDNIVWNMESFDTDEFPDMPLVPLPDELEDIVGELLDQAAAIEAQSQDTTGNNMLADGEMGWGIMDGPMPNFSAKGKSGNTRPNDNEMTGRSGAGREGQSNGELVENRVKGLTGRETHARRTQDPFQKGMVTEDETSTLDARATGGGKLGGQSETIGMFGKAPRRDLHTGSHGTSPTALRQETEAVYATARLLYLGTGSLGIAARELRGIESARDRMKEFGSLHRRVLRRLEDSQVELKSGVVLPMPVATVSRTGGAAAEDVDLNRIADEYRDIVSDYYRSLQAE